MCKTRIPLVLVLLFSIFTLVVSTGFAKDNKIKWTHAKKHSNIRCFNQKRYNPIQWSQKKLEIDAEGRESFSTDVQFQSKRSLSKFSLQLAPELQPFISITPSYFKKIRKGRKYTVKINVSIPDATEIGLYKGTIRPGKNHKRKSHTHAVTDALKIRLSIVDDDGDGDGYTDNQGDCDDTDAAINPDAQEICDGIDNNCDGQTDEPVISFTSPEDGSTINSTSTLVRGTINTCSQEVGIMVNGVPAAITENEFAANDISLAIGSNTITAVATDENGNTATDTITVYTMLYQDQVTLSSDITSGLSPLDVKFTIDTQLSNPITTYEIDFEGDGTQDQTITDLDNVSFTYEQEGIYYPTITVTDDQGYQYTDTIAINVLSLEKMDALFNEKWGGMKSALINQDIEAAVASFDEGFREVYRDQFTELSSVLNTIGSELGNLRLVTMDNTSAEYEIIVTREGVIYSYYLSFVRDKDGLWKIRAF